MKPFFSLVKTGQNSNLPVSLANGQEEIRMIPDCIPDFRCVSSEANIMKYD